MSAFLDWFENLFKEAQSFLAPFERQFISGVGPIVLQAAEAAVVALAAQSMPGAQKQTAAFQQIVTNLQSQSITVAASVINGAIEVAVANLKAQ